MKTLHIEWKQLPLDKDRCLRCSKTGKTIQQVISELSKELKEKNNNIKKGKGVINEK